jgi:hypothetical protein
LQNTSWKQVMNLERCTTLCRSNIIKKNGKHLDTVEKFYIYRETEDNNQLNDKHTIIHNKIFETITENEMNTD